MNKKILIASLFATLMLMVPMTSVMGVSDVEEDCGCQVVNSSDLFKVKLLSVRLKVITNILLLKIRYIPEIADKCNEILDTINSDEIWELPIICDTLYWMCEYTGSLEWYLLYLSEYVFEENPLLINLCNSIITLLYMIATSFWYIAALLDCEWADIWPSFP